MHMSLSRHLSNYTTGRPQYVIVVNPLSLFVRLMSTIINNEHIAWSACDYT